jgi:hypothetical protein
LCKPLQHPEKLVNNAKSAKRFLEASNYNVQEAIRSFQSKQPIEYYAGGEKSGVAIQGTDIVEDILKMAEQLL